MAARREKGLYSVTRGGKRPDLGNQYFRSRWEANYARYLNWLIEQAAILRWEYEPDTFEFHKIKRGSRFYTPDFKVFNLDGSYEYHEVKGYMDSASVTKLKRMEKYYPQEKILIIARDEYRAVAKCKRLFVGWEYDSEHKESG